jgi:hypothetical protein
MIVYLADFATIAKTYRGSSEDIWLLSSYYKHSKDKQLPAYLYQSRHILDSGAFSFFGNKRAVDWDSYVDQYVEFIQETKQRLFFEMDVDVVTGLKRVEQLRTRIELKTGKQTIPVWRPSRGVQYWHKMVRAYKYVAISASGKYDSAWVKKPEADNVLQKMIAIAHDNDTKVHGLGFTTVNRIQRIKWDSVDSTRWIAGAQYGNVMQFTKQLDGTIVMKSHKPPPGYRGKDREQMNQHNFVEWVKFQRWMELKAWRKT